MTTIAEKIAARATDLLHEDDPATLREAIQAVIDKTETWRLRGFVSEGFADEILLTLAKPLGLNIVMGKWAQQLEDLDAQP